MRANQGHRSRPSSRQSFYHPTRVTLAGGIGRQAAMDRHGRRVALTDARFFLVSRRLSARSARPLSRVQTHPESSQPEPPCPVSHRCHATVFSPLSVVGLANRRRGPVFTLQRKGMPIFSQACCPTRLFQPGRDVSYAARPQRGCTSPARAMHARHRKFLVIGRVGQV